MILKTTSWPSSVFGWIRKTVPCGSSYRW